MTGRDVNEVVRIRVHCERELASYLPTAASVSSRHSTISGCSSTHCTTIFLSISLSF